MQVTSLQGYGLPVWGPNNATKSLLATGTWSHSVNSQPDSASLLRISKYVPGGAILLSQTQSPTRFSALDWTDQFDERGIIAGGMEDGAITLWSVGKILEQDADQPIKMGRGCVSVAQLHGNVPVRTLEFNPNKKNLLASGGSEVLIQDISQMKKPEKFKPGEPNFHQGHRITSISWNRIVQHILASASEDGKIVVWDLKSSKSIFQFTEPKLSTASEYDYFSTEASEGEKSAGTMETQIIWNPVIPTQFVVANDDDQNQSINIWDLRNPQYPVATYANLHQAGISSVSWCLQDSNLVASSSKDERTIVTNFQTGETVLEFPGKSLNSNIRWASKLPGKLAATTAEGDTTILSYQRCKPSDDNEPSSAYLNQSSSVYTPKWLQPNCGGARFGFGGKLIHFQGKCLKAYTEVTDPNEQNMCQLVEQFDKELQQALQMSDLQTFIERKAITQVSHNEKLELLAIKALATGDKTELMKEFGIDTKKITFEVERFLGKQIQKKAEPAQQKKVTHTVVTENPFAQQLGSMSAESAADFFANLGSESETAARQPTSQKPKPQQEEIDHQTNQKEILSQETISRNTNWNAGPEAMIKKNLMIGNHKYAAEVALKIGRTTEAFLIAEMGGQSMLQEIQDMYFEQQKDPFLRNILQPLFKEQLTDAIFNKQNQQVLDQLSTWQEKITYINTYVDDQTEMEDLIFDLAKSLMARKEVGPAIICFILSHSVNEVLELWRLRVNFQLKQAQTVQQRQQIQISQFERCVLYKLVISKAGLEDTAFNSPQFQKVINDVVSSLSGSASAAHIALKFSQICISSDKQSQLAHLRDRLYHAHQDALTDGGRVKYQVPEVPFDVVRIQSAVQQRPQQQQQVQQRVFNQQPQRQPPMPAQRQQPAYNEPPQQQPVRDVQPPQQQQAHSAPPKKYTQMANFGYGEQTALSYVEEQKREQPARQKPQPQPRPVQTPNQPRMPRPAPPISSPPSVQQQQHYQPPQQSQPTPPPLPTPPPVMSQQPRPMPQQQFVPPSVTPQYQQNQSQQQQMVLEQPINTVVMGGQTIARPQANAPPRNLAPPKAQAPPRAQVRPQLPKMVQPIQQQAVQQQSFPDQQQQQMQQQPPTGYAAQPPPPKVTGPPPMGPPPGGSGLRPMNQRR